MKFQIGVLIISLLFVGLHAASDKKTLSQDSKEISVSGVPICHTAEVIVKILVDNGANLVINDVALSLEGSGNFSVDLTAATVTIDGLQLANLTNCTYLSGNRSVIIFTVDEITVGLTDYEIDAILFNYPVVATGSGSIKLVNIVLTLLGEYIYDDNNFAHLLSLEMDFTTSSFEIDLVNEVPEAKLQSISEDVLKRKIMSVLERSFRFD